MITNKDISIDNENGQITLNGNKYDLGTQGEIDTAVKGVYSVMGQMGAKNLIPYPYYETTKTIGTLTFTDNGDGSITVNGTATQNSTFYLSPQIWNNEEIKGEVILSAGGAPFNNSFKLTVETPLGTNKNLVDNGELPITITAPIRNIRLFVANGTTVDNVTVYPMLRLAADTDNTYEPYAMTNKQLTDELDTARVQLTNLPTAMATGKATFPAAAIGDQDIEVQFPAGTFTSAPVVTATMYDTTPFNVVNYMEADLYVYNVTKDSFFIRGKRKNANDAWFANWIAVQM